VTRLGRWEWAFAAQAVARGDLLLLLDDETGAARPLDAGDRVWLLPSWRNERHEPVKRTWWAELSRSSRERTATGEAPVRSVCEIVSSHELDDELRARIAPLHPWSAEHAALARRALVVRARARVVPEIVAVEEARERYVELTRELPEDDLLPALTDEAFALHRAIVERNLEPADAPRG
jgi:hypothetical protein